MYSIDEAAKILSVPSGQLARWVARGRIPSATLVDGKSGKVWRLPRQTVDAVARQVRHTEEHGETGTDPGFFTPPTGPSPDRRDRKASRRQIEQMVARERAHWQQLSEQQADTIANLRSQLQQTQRKLTRLQERQAQRERGERSNPGMSRSTRPISGQTLVPMKFPQLEMP